MSEILKFLNDLSSPIINGIFRKQENYYSLRNSKLVVSEQKFITTYGFDTISFGGLRIWQDLPEEIENSDSCICICVCRCIFWKWKFGNLPISWDWFFFEEVDNIYVKLEQESIEHSGR